MVVWIKLGNEVHHVAFDDDEIADIGDEILTFVAYMEHGGMRIDAFVRHEVEAALDALEADGIVEYDYFTLAEREVM